MKTRFASSPDSALLGSRLGATAGLRRHALVLVLVLVVGGSLAAQPDVRPTNLTMVPTTLSHPASVSVTWRDQNIGNYGTLNLWNDAVYFNPNAPSLAGATLLSTQPHVQRPYVASGTYSPYVTWSGPIPPSLTANLAYGFVYIGIRANLWNSAGWPVPEVNYSNNWAWRQVRWEARPDLQFQSLSGSGLVVSGGNITIQASIRNANGNIGNGNSVAQFYLNSTQSLSGAVQICSFPIPTLPAGTSFSLNQSCALPAPISLNPCYLVGKVDALGTVSESNENNNIASTLLVCGPELTVTSLSASTPVLEGGHHVQISASVQNAGAAAGPFQVGIYLSMDSFITTTDPRLGSMTIPGIPGVSAWSGSVTVALPAVLGPGSQHLGAFADDLAQVPEQNESNNTRSVPVSCVDLGPGFVIVDAANGPGAGFTNLPAAVNAAPPGGKLFLRTGTYLPAFINKPLTILGEPGNPGAQISVTASSPSFEITGLTPGQTVVLRDLGITGGGTTLPSNPPFSIHGSTGRVHLQNVRASLPLIAFSALPPAVDIDGCSQVTLTECVFAGAPAVRSRNSTVVINGGSYAGRHGSLLSQIGFPCSAGITVDGGEIIAAFASVAGGDGVQNIPPCPAIVALTASTALTVAGDAGTTLDAGNPGSGAGAPALQGSGGPLIIDPAAMVAPSGIAPPTSGFGPVTTAFIPASYATNAAVDGTGFELAVRASAIYPTVLFASLAADLSIDPVLGRIWFDPNNAAFIPMLAPNASGRSALPVSLPRDANLRGLTFVLQPALVGLTSQPPSVPVMLVVE